MVFRFGPEKVKLKRVIDGDTFDLHIDLGFRVYTVKRFRLDGVDTPEIYGVKKDSEEYKRGIAAKEFVEKMLTNYSFSLVSLDQDPDIYGRWIGVIYVHMDEGTFKLSDQLIRNGFKK